ncbi:hypothetical protein RB24_10990 [Herbaspirillum rubrisubalbicans]|uniref:Uncharacterized protein n=1 Tax=Herbaspirillum rubrisubalbicans TaxID=80842 RepID=A0ABX9C2Z6_9BURK|nr:hypothetical protein RB24_10990 [Herbaspirillum rubrisubalbicans]
MSLSIPFIRLTIDPLHAASQSDMIVDSKGDARMDQQEVAGLIVLFSIVAALVEAIGSGKGEHNGIKRCVGSKT